MATKNVVIQGDSIQFKNGADTTIQLTASSSNVLDVGHGTITTTATSFTNSTLVTKNYVDNVARGLDVKESVRFASKGNLIYDASNNTIKLSDNIDYPDKIDIGSGNSLVDNDRVLIKDQTNQWQNGIYTFDAGNQTFFRSIDFNTTPYITKGAFTFVYDGADPTTESAIYSKNTGWAVSSLGSGTTFLLNDSSSTGNIVFTKISSQADNYKNASLIDQGELDSARLALKSDGGLSTSVVSGVNKLTIADSGVTNTMLSGGITNQKLSTDGKIPFTSTGIMVNSNTTGNLELGTPTSFTIGTSAITNAMIQDQSVSNSKIEDDTITLTKLNSAIRKITLQTGVTDGLEFYGGTSGGEVALGSSVSLRVQSQGITNNMLAGSISNDKLSNKHIQVKAAANSGLQITNGSGAVITGTTLDVNLGETFELSVPVSGIATDMIAPDSVDNSKITNPWMRFKGDGGISVNGIQNELHQLHLGTNLIVSLPDDSLVNAKYQNLSITGEKIQNNTIPNSKLQNSSIILNTGAGLGFEGGLTSKTISLSSTATTEISIQSGGIVNNMIASGTITNDRLVNSNITFNTTDGVYVSTNATETTVALGSTIPIGIIDGGITNVKLAGSITNDKLSNSQIHFASGDGIELDKYHISLSDSSAPERLTISIKNDSIVGTMIKNLEITNDKLSNSGEINLQGENGIQFVNANAGEGNGKISLGGTITIKNSQPLDATANVTFATVTTTSDPRLKANMTPLENTLTMIDSINGYSFNWINGDDKEKLQFGLNADEIENVNPDIVKLNDNGYKSVNYNAVIAILVNAVKELKEEVTSLKARLP